MLRAAPDRAGAFVEATQLEPSFQAARFAAEVAAIWVAAIADPAGRAGLLNNREHALGCRAGGSEALAASEEAVELLPPAAAARPDAFMPHLATIHSTPSANMLSNLGRREEALAAARRRSSSDASSPRARPDAFLPDLAMSLNNLGDRLSDLGRREEALAATEEAVAIRRRAGRAPTRRLPARPGRVAEQPRRSASPTLGRREEALAATEEAVDDPTARWPSADPTPSCPTWPGR